jgi:hypothetical protein
MEKTDMSDHQDQSTGGGTPTELFTTVPVDLFRMGNASGPRLDNIREQDVPITTVRVGDQDVEMVSPEGGISTFDDYRAKPGKWWKIPSGVTLPQTIRIVKDGYNRQMRAWHYSVRPAYLMPKLTFAEGLRSLANHAMPMFTQPINQDKSGNQNQGGGTSKTGVG